MRLQQTSSDGDLGGQAEFRIDRFEHHVIVYIPGTKQWSAKAGDNPLDLTSNVHAIGSESDGSTTPAASERSVLAALRAAGVGAGDQVLLVGHSQGGIIAANIAARHNAFQVAGILTFGSPIAAASIDPNCRVIAIEHTNDPVPTLDGGPNAIRENWITVREHYDLKAKQNPIAVHDLAGYIETAGRLDSSKSSNAASALGFIRQFAGRYAGRTEWYSARRVG
jgi:pimeloyl-ACP methyl ester carboxylesterase